MAEAKKTTVKKTTTKKPAKAAEKVADKKVKALAANAELLASLRKMTVAEIDKALVEAKADLKQAQKLLRANELPATHVIKTMKAKIARIHAVATEKKNAKEAK